MDKLELLKQLIKNDPKNSSTWFLLGLEYKEMGNYGKALQTFAEALKYADGDLRDKVIEELGHFSEDRKTQMQKEESSGFSRRAQQWDEDNLDVNDLNEEESDAGYEDEMDDQVGNPFMDSGKAALRVIQGGQGKPNPEIIEMRLNRVNFEDVGGLEELKDTIRMKIIKPFTNPGIFAKFKKKTGGGILLFGPPGCGKTFIARATAGEVGASFTPVHITDIVDPYFGMSEQNIRDTFLTARANKPSVLFFDEIDSIGYNRSKSSSDILRPIVDQMLAEMEGIESNSDQLLIIGATNMPWDIDPAFLRPGRFDRVIFVPPPDEKARVKIFALKLKDKPSENINLERLAKETQLYSGADIENVVEIATEKVITEIMHTDEERPIRMGDLLSAIKETRPSTIGWLNTVKNYVKYANQSGMYNEVTKYLDTHKKWL